MKTCGLLFVSCLLACTTIDEPRTASTADGAVPNELDDAGVDAAVESPCLNAHNWRIRGLPASFFAGPTEGTGAWGLGDYFKQPDGTKTVILDAYVVGSADELRGRFVELGKAPQTEPDTLTHLFTLRLGCNDDGRGCASGFWVPTAGKVIATRLAPHNATSLEIHAENLVLHRADLKDGKFVLVGDGPEACEFFHRLVVGGVTSAPTMTCAEKAYPECPFVKNADRRHP